MAASQKAKQYTRVMIIYAAVFIIYNLIVLLLFSGKTAVYWISYAFMCLAFVANIGALGAAFKRDRAGNVGEAIFWGIPLFSFSIFYFFGELFLSFVFMLFRKHASIKLTIVLQVIFLLVFIIFAMLALISRDAASDVSANVATKVREMKLLGADVAALERDCTDRELKAQLHKVTEAIQYADPMSNDSVALLDDQIWNAAASLEDFCRDADTDAEAKQNALATCKQLLSQIAKRNDRLRLSK